MSDGSVIQSIESACAAVSLIACLCMGIKIRREGTSNIANKMLSFLFVLDFILALAYVVGRAAMPVHGFCQFQGLIIQWFSLAAIFWVVLMAYQMRQWIVAKKNPKRIEASMRNSMLFILISTGILGVALWGGGAFGPAYMWCWIKHEYQIARFFCFDLILVACWALIAYYLWEVSVSIGVRMKRSSMNARVLELLNSNTSIQRKLMFYVSLFVAVWFFALLNRFLEWGLDRPVFATSVIQVIVLPLQGFFNALAFGDVFGWLSSIGIGDESTHSVVHNKDIRPTHTLREVLIDPPKSETGSKKPPSVHSKNKQYSVFITTLNMGEAPLHTIMPDLPVWILEGHDVYAVGVQECLDLTGVMHAVHTHLGRDKYAGFTTSIGSGNTSLGYHGFIALMLFVKHSELKSGHIVPTVPSISTMATGADLIVTTAQNKGAVGLPLQIHDTSICFVTCHLPSDSKGKSKLSKRNASAHSIMKGLTLAPEDAGFDLHLQHDHVLVFGDLNYRMDSVAAGGGMGSLTGVAVACLIEKSALNDDPNWLRRRYNLMRNPSDPLFPSIEEIKLLKSARASSKGAWSSVLRADELRSIMADGDAFSGFDEPMPCFPPSYKRKKGDTEGECGDYTDPLKIIQGFTNTGEVQELLRDGENEPQQQTIAAKKLRPPSYTDRILIHSLPDRQDRVTVQAYDFCDRLRVSDHRAVSMTVRLEVNTQVNFQNHAPVSIGTIPEVVVDPKKEPKFQLYELSLSNLNVVFDARQGAADDEGDSGSEEEEEEEGEEGNEDGDDGLDDDAEDALQNQNTYANSRSNSKAASALVTEGSEGFAIDNPLHKNPVADAYMKKNRPASVRGVKFADDSGRGVSIEMSPQNSNASSSSSTPSTSPMRGSHMSEYASAHSSSENNNSKVGATTNRVSFGTVDKADETEKKTNKGGATTNRVSFGAPPVAIDTSSAAAATSTSAETTAATISSPTSVSPLLSSSSPTSSPRPSAAPGPAPSAAPAGGRGMPGAGRGGMLSRAKSANAASLNFNTRLSNSNDKPLDLADNSTASADTTMATVSSVSSVSTEDSFPRSNLHQSLLANTASSTAPADESKSRIMFSPDRSKSDTSASRPLSTSSNASTASATAKKHRSRSIFGAFLSSKPITNLQNNDEQGDILNEISRDSFSWDSGDDAVEGGQWKKKLAEDEAQRKLNRATSGKIVKKIKKAKRKLKNDKKVFQIIIVFPLPSKDPLLSHRKLYEYSSIYSLREGEGKLGVDLERHTSTTTASQHEVTKEALLRPLSLFPWIEDATSKSGSGNNKLKQQQLQQQIQQQMLVPGSGGLDNAEAGGAGVNNNNNSSNSSSGGAGNSRPTSTRLNSVTSNTYKVTGCASPELGAHVLVKLMNRSGYELGSAVVSLTHLLHTSTEEVRATHFPSITISSGGQQRGTLSGKFSLKFLPSVMSTPAGK